jgi:predicted DNA-binding transcriptional regulator YafY
MGAHREKRDRTARLLKIQVLLGQNPGGLKIAEIARRCSVSVRTTYRDLDALEAELNVPIWQKGNVRGVVEGYHLPPLFFTIQEAMNISLAARLMQSHSRWYDPHRASMLVKLNSVVPPPLRKQIENTIDRMEKQPRNEKQIEISEKLAEAWISQRRATVLYREQPDREPREFVIEPYFIEPATPGNFGFVIAYSQAEKSVAVLKISCIEQLRVEPEGYAIPDDFDVVRYLSPAWGVSIDEPLQTVKLHFKPRPSRPIVEAIWDRSQVVEPRADGSLMMTLRVIITAEFRAWVLGWGSEVEVIAPPSLKREIIRINEAVRRMYARRRAGLEGVAGH